MENYEKHAPGDGTNTDSIGVPVTTQSNNRSVQYEPLRLIGCHISLQGVALTNCDIILNNDTIKKLNLVTSTW